MVFLQRFFLSFLHLTLYSSFFFTVTTQPTHNSTHPDTRLGQKQKEKGRKTSNRPVDQTRRRKFNAFHNSQLPIEATDARRCSRTARRMQLSQSSSSSIYPPHRAPRRHRRHVCTSPVHAGPPRLALAGRRAQAAPRSHQPRRPRPLQIVPLSARPARHAGVDRTTHVTIITRPNQQQLRLKQR